MLTIAEHITVDYKINEWDYAKLIELTIKRKLKKSLPCNNQTGKYSRTQIYGMKTNKLKFHIAKNAHKGECLNCKCIKLSPFWLRQRHLKWIKALCRRGSKDFIHRISSLTWLLATNWNHYLQKSSRYERSLNFKINSIK